MFTVLMMAGPGLELTVPGREKERVWGCVESEKAWKADPS